MCRTRAEKRSRPAARKQPACWPACRPAGSLRRHVHVLIAILLAAPLGLRTQGPLRELFLDMTGADARPIDRTVIDVRWSMANTWNEFMTLVRNEQQARQELDEQADSIALRIAIPWPWASRVL